LFTWTFAHHLLLDTCIWFPIYIDRRNSPGCTQPPLRYVL
jgi:hypothetical protein